MILNVNINVICWSLGVILLVRCNSADSNLIMCKCDYLLHAHFYINLI